jgi:hypothetical protein
LLHAISGAFHWRFLNKTILFSDLKIPYKKNPPNKKTRVCSFCRTENKDRKPDKTRVYAQKPRLKNAIQEFHLWSEEMSSKLLRINSHVNVKRELMQIPDLVTLSI